MARLILSLFGPLQIKLDEQPLTWFESDKIRALLIYLAVAGRAPQRRSRLAHLLWPDSTEKAARHSLSQALFNLRQVIGDRDSVSPFLLATRHDIQMNEESDIWVDVVAFREKLAACQAHYPYHSDLGSCDRCLERLENAAALYQGAFLDQFFLADCDVFEAWAEEERNTLSQLALQAFQSLADGYESRGNYEMAEFYIRQQLKYDPYREQAHQRLMQLLAQQGQRQAALAQYDLYRQMLSETFPSVPAPELDGLYRQIRDNGFAKEATSALVSLPNSRLKARCGNLPVPQTPFIGRHTEIKQIQQYLLDTDCRLLALTGSGGIGKTRLALETARLHDADFTDGVCFVPLAPLGNPGNVMPAIADCLQLTFYEGRDPRDQLLDFLSSRHLLLLLDNVEHLLGQPAQNGKDDTVESLITHLLQAAPRLKILITSRERLDWQQGQTYIVNGLEVPGETSESRVSAACQLFQERALRLEPGLDVTDTASQVRLCRLLEGNPLALELAATMVITLPLPAIAAEIGNNLDALAVDSPDLEPRHRSIRAVFDSSWHTLSVSEQAVFARLSVFRGGFTREAAVTVAGATLSDLTGLIRKSLLSHHHGRYGMHELMRQYATERLAQMPQQQSMCQQQHSDYYGRVLERQIQRWQSNYQPSVMEAIGQEIDNVRAGLSWIMTQNKLQKLPPYLRNLWCFYHSRGRLVEAVAMINEAVALVSRQPAFTLQQGEWEGWLGTAYWGLGKLDIGQAHLQKALRLLEQPMPLTHGRLLAELLGQCFKQLCHRLWPKWPSGQEAEGQGTTIAAEIYEQLAEIAYLDSKMLPTLYCTVRALNLAEKAPLSPIQAVTYANMMIACGSFGLHRGAEKYAQLADKVATTLNDLPTLGAVAERHGLYCNAIGNWACSRRVIEQALTIFQKLEDERNQGDCLSNLAYEAYFQGDFARYKAYWAQLDKLAQISHNVQHQSWAYTGQAQGLVGLGRLDEALVMLAKAEPLLKYAPDTLIGKMGYYSIMALARLRRGDYTQALASADIVLALLKQCRPISYVVTYVYNELAEVYLTLWERALAGDPSVSALASPLQEKAQLICHSFYMFSWQHPVGRPYALFYRGKFSWLLGHRSRARRAWHKSLLQAQKLHMNYLEGLAHFELGRHINETGDEHLRCAKAIFTRLDTAYNLKQMADLTG